MTPLNWNNTAVQAPLAPSAAQKTSGSTANAAQDSGAQNPADTVQLSPAAREAALTGRIALNQDAGNISSTQAQQLYGQVASIHTQIVADKQADGGTLSAPDAQAIQQLQNQLSQTVYGDAHNGAAPPPDPSAGRAGAREALQAGRITLNEQAGNLSNTQAQQLTSQLAGIDQQIVADKQADGGTLSPADARAINQQQNQLSQQIHDAAHGAGSSDQTPGAHAV